MKTLTPGITLLGVALALVLFGCHDSNTARDVASANTISPEQSAGVTLSPTRPTALDSSPLLCETRMPQDVVEQCEPGQTLVFLPQRWGSEQFPLVAVALGCDLTKQVVITSGGVVCTVKPPITPREPIAPESADPIRRYPGSIS